MMVYYFKFLLTKVRADNLIKQAGLITAEGCINHLIEEYTGEHFVIPNFCINDPYFEKQIINDQDCINAIKNNEVIKVIIIQYNI